MGKVSLQLAYDGPALDEGLMDVRDLAPALLAFGDLVQEASTVLYGQDHKIRVDVRAQFRKGSFGIDLELVTTFWQAVIGALTSPQGQTIVALLGLIGLSGKDGAKLGVKGFTTLIDLIRRLKGRAPQRTIKNPDGSITIIVDDGEAWTVTPEVARLAADSKVRIALDAVIAPLDQEGIEVFEARAPDGTPTERITKEERQYFSAPSPIALDDATPLVDQEVERVLGVVSLSFKDSNKWRFSDGDSVFFAKIEDARFLRDIETRKISFTKGDALRCRVRLQQVLTPNGIRNDWTILEVLGRYEAPRQLTMPMPEGE